MTVSDGAAATISSYTVSSQRMGEQWWLREYRRTLLECRHATPNTHGHCGANLRSLSSVGAERQLQHRSNRSTYHVHVRRLERLWRLRLLDTFAKANAGCFADRYVRRAVQRSVRADCRLCACFVSAGNNIADANANNFDHGQVFDAITHFIRQLPEQGRQRDQQHSPQHHHRYRHHHHHHHHHLLLLLHRHHRQM
jgi:hypothetical protein